MGSETLPAACYILSDESSIPFYSTSNGIIKLPNIGDFNNYFLSMICAFHKISFNVKTSII